MNSKKRRERKQMITLIVSAGVILLLMAVYFIIRNATSEGEDTDRVSPDIGESGTFSIVEENYKNVTAISYKYGDVELSLHIEDSKWVLDDDTPFPVDQDKLIDMSQAISDYGGFGRIIYNEANAEAYGTNDPTLDITVTYYKDDGSSTYARRFIVGKKNTTTGYYYFYEPGNTYIYTVNDSLLPYYKYDKADLFAGTVTPTPNLSDIKLLTVEYDKGVYKFDAETDGEPADNDEDPVKRIMNSVPKEANMQYENLEAYGVGKDEMSKYGLDAPSLRVSLTYVEYSSITTSDGNSTAQISRDRDFTILFGDRVTEGEGESAREYVYVCVEGSDVVYKVDAERYEGIYSVVTGSEE